MSESQQDPSANTGRFRAFVEEAPLEPVSSGVSRGTLIWVACAAVAVLIVVLVAVL
jgi:hypothetical protein